MVVVWRRRGSGLIQKDGACSGHCAAKQVPPGKGGVIRLHAFKLSAFSDLLSAPGHSGSIDRRCRLLKAER
jgi:hypothetical protein